MEFYNKYGNWIFYILHGVFFSSIYGYDLFDYPVYGILTIVVVTICENIIRDSINKQIKKRKKRFDKGMDLTFDEFKKNQINK